MRLYVKNNGRKIYLRRVAKTRNQLARQLGSSYLRVKGIRYSVNDVRAEKDGSKTAAGGLLGGLVGLFGGPIGVLTGAALGSIIGNSSESREEQSVRIFNQSRYEKLRV